MGKVIARKIGGMSRWAKWSIVLLFTLLTSIFMYKGWYKPLNAEAAIARVQSVTLNNGSNTAGTITIAPTHAGNLLVVVIGGIQTTTGNVSNVKLGSTPLTLAKDIVVSGGPQYVSIWYLANIPAGQTTVTYTSTAVDNGAVVAEYSGIATTSPLDVTASAGSSSTSSTLSTGTATSSAANELWIGAFGDNTSSTFSAVTGTNASMYAQTAAFGTQLGLADSITNSAGPATMGCTGANDWWAGAIAVFKPAAGAPAPTVTSTSPNNMAQGTGPTTVTITGTGFQSGAAVAFSGTGVTTGAVTVVNATTITVPVTVAAGATTGALNVTVTNPDAGAGTGTGVFTVNPAAVCTANTPTISVTPTSSTVTSGGAATTYTVTVTNNDTAACASTVFTLTKSDNNAGVFTSSLLSPTTLTLAPGANGTATFTVSAPAGAANGASNVTTLGVSATGHTAPANITATTTVSNPAPTVTTATPNSGTQGATSLSVTIGGTNFVSGATTAFSGTGITVNSTTFVSATQLTANITIAAGATTGARNITVTNPDTQSAILTNGFTVNASVVCTANTPSLSIAPTSATVKAGNGQGYTVTVVNNDTTACSSTTFTLNLANSNATDFTTSSLASLTLSLAPGISGTSGFTVTAGAAAATGAANTSTVGVSATAHTAPANVTGVTTVNNTVISPLTHSSVNLGTKYGNWGTNYNCTTCHNEATNNIKNIAATITTPTGARSVVFNQLTASQTTAMGVFGNDQRATLTQTTNVCEVCHHNTIYHQYSSSKAGVNLTHNNRKDCMLCHPHSVGFKAGCSGCHGYPPTDATLGTSTGLVSPASGATSPASAGAHAIHVTTRSMTCNTCHTGTTMPTLDNKITVGFAINGSNWPGFVGSVGTYNTYSGHTPLNSPYTFNSGSVTTTVATGAGYRNSCDVYCHANWPGSNGSLNPSWVITDGTQKACGTCHGASAATPPTTGSHVRHAGNGATSLALTCDKCHGAHTDNSHVNGNVKWDLTGIATTAQYKTPAGAYATTGGTNAVAPSASYGQCNNIYCHSTVQGATGSGAPATYATPTWGGAALTCGSCHADMSGVSGSGSHPKHANTAKIACSLCHGVGYNSTTVTYPKHANGFINISTNGYATGTTYSKGKSITPGSAVYGTCSNGYCHSNGTGGTLQTGDTRGVAANTSPAWGSTDTCTTCHASPPNYANYTSNTSITGQKANSHQGTTHLAQTCDVCHNSVSTTNGGVTYTTYTSHNNGRYSLKASLGYTFGVKGGTCATPGCHGSAKWGGQLGCVNCHNTTITRTLGRPGEQLANIVAEFGLAYGHKKSGNSAVTDADCIVCHLEGDSTTGKVSATYHKNGNIDLRDPDGATTEAPITNMSGAAFTFQRFTTSYVAGSRTSTGNTSNNIDNVITQKFCLKCHDATGATNPGARVGGAATSQYKPFNRNIGDANYVVPLSAGVTNGVVDVDSMFATTNSTFHPVKGPQNNSYAANSRMNAPYGVTKTNGTPSAGVVINCFDCHNVSGAPLTRRTVSAHGNPAWLRGTAYDTTNSLCKICHNGYQTATGGMGHGSGSAFYSSVDSGMDTYMTNQCQKCHASTDTAVRPTRAEDAHGFSYFAGNGTDKMWPRGATETYKMYAFIRNTNQWSSSNWQPLSGPGVPAGGAQCGGNMTTSACSDTMTGYTPGGVY